MGSCQSAQVRSSSTATIASKAIDAELKTQLRGELTTTRLLLLGPGQSGKSTLFKQVKILHQDGYSDEERREFIPTIHQNVAHNMVMLTKACGCDQLDLALPDELKGMAEDIKAEYRAHQTVTLTPAITETIRTLWSSPVVQSLVAQEGSKIRMVADSIRYFFDRLDDVTASDYLPTDEDILQARVRTTSVAEITFELEGSKFELLDVGGQRSERRKWIHCFDNVQGLLFVAAINGFDQTLEEDPETNRLQEALNVFEDICNSRFFRDTPVILFLNKKDLFAEKIKRVNITTAFPEYDGPQEHDAALDYIRAQFESMNEQDTKQIYAHVTCATDTNNIRVVFDMVKDIMLNLNLQNSGFI